MEPQECVSHVSWHHHQHYAMIPNDVAWYWHVIIVLVIASLVSWGVKNIGDVWRRELKLAKWTKLVPDVMAVVMSTIIGTMLGHVVWSWEFGAIIAFTGSLSYRWVLGVVKGRLSK